MVWPGRLTLLPWCVVVQSTSGFQLDVIPEKELISCPSSVVGRVEQWFKLNLMMDQRDDCEHQQASSRRVPSRGEAGPMVLGVADAEPL